MDPVRALDPDALADFYDRHAGNVREYCALICPEQFADEATFVAFRDFLARMGDADVEEDLDELLWKATRGAAAGRAEVRAEVGSAQGGELPQTTVTQPQATCLAMPELLAAYVSGELPRNGDLDRHLVDCLVCRSTAMRFRDAEAAFTHTSGEQPPETIRRAWLEIATTGRAA
ncbi:MAG: hypothetical protein M3065_11760 [Actinomycetota bacterium]|nr:hypothetical protein [Actinomycetota bacterium]